jgi:hypothetical protein
LPPSRRAVRFALQHQAAIAKALRARAEEDARAPLDTDEQERAVMQARRRRAMHLAKDESSCCVRPWCSCRSWNPEPAERACAASQIIDP